MIESMVVGVTFWVENGNTLRFEHVTNFVIDASVIEFDYVSMSDKKKKHASFRKRGIIGVSTWTDENNG